MSDAMDVLTCQFIEKLKCGEPVESRLSVAKRVFTSFSIPMVGKEETVILSLCELATSDNTNFLKIVTCLRECFESKRMLSHSGHFRPEIVDRLLEVFKFGISNELGADEKSALLRLSVAILSAPYFQRWFSCDATRFCAFLGDAFSASPASSADVIAKLLSLASQVCKSSLFKAEIRLSFIENTYAPLCKALTAVGDDELLSKAVDTFVDVVLYDPAFLEEFSARKDETASKENPQHSRALRTILKREVKATESDKTTVSACFTVFLKSSAKLSSQRQNLEIVFDIFTALCSILGCKVDKRISITWKAMKNWNHSDSFGIIGEMIKILDDVEVPLSIDRGTYSLDSWFTSLVVGTMNTNLTQLSPELFKMAELAVKYDPLIIENCLKSVAEVMVRKKPKSTASSYESLMTACISGSLQTQRFQKFTASLFANLKRAIDANSAQKRFEKVVLKDVIPAEVSERFAEAIIAIPHTQMLAVFKDLLDRFQQDCLRSLEANCEDNATILATEIYAELLKQFLTSVKIADHSVPDSVKSRFNVLFDDLKNVLEKMGTLFVDNHNDRVINSYLNICHSFGAVQLMVNEYEGAPIKPISKPDLVPLNFSYVHPYLSPQQWKTLGESIVDHDDCFARHSLYNMMVQKIEAVAQVEEGFEGPGAQTARRLIKMADTEWLWSEITSLAVLCQANELVQLVGSLIDSLGTCQDRWLSLVNGEELIENRRLVLALALQLLYKSADYIATDGDTLAKDVMSKMPMADLLEYELSLLLTDDEELAGEIGNAVREVKKILNDRLAVDFDKKVFVDASFVRVLHALPLHHFSPLSQNCLFLGVLALLGQLAPFSDTDILLLDILFRILNSSSANGNSILASLDSGRVIELISARGSNYKSLRFLLHMVCKESLADRKASKKLIKSVSRPTVETVWLTGLVIEAIQQLKVKKKTETTDETKEPFALEKDQALNSLVRLVTPILETETPSVQLLPTFSQVLNLQLKTGNDYGGQSLQKKIDEYLRFSLTDPEQGIPLMETLISHRHRLENKDLHKSIVIEYWELSKNCGKLVPKINFIYNSSNDDEFQTIVTDLSAETTAAIYGHDCDRIKMLFDLWCPLLAAQMSSSKSKIRQNALVILAKNLPNLLPHWKSTPNAPSVKPTLKFFSELACNIAVDIQPAILDILLVCLQSVPLPVENAAALLDNLTIAVEALFALYLFRNALILDRLHVYWPICKNYLSELAKVGTPDTEYLTETVSCADKLERVAKAMAKRQKDFSRIAEMFIADVISILEKNPLHPEVKSIYNNIINVFLALCDDHAVSYLSFSLPPASQELFKTYHHNFKKYHKYQGQI